MSAIAEAVRTAKKSDVKEVNAAAEALLQLDAKIAEVRGMKKGLLGIERHAKLAIEKKLREMYRERIRLQSLSRLGDYSCMSFEPLKWRDKDGWPRLVILDLESPKFQLSCAGRRSFSGRKSFRSVMHPKLPDGFPSCYGDVSKKLNDMARSSGKSVHLTTEYSGLIPAATKEKIATAKTQFKAVFMIAEANKWTLEKTAIPRPADPLIVGFDGTHLWIVDHFDMTTIEKYIKAEFAV